eukprot:1183989-Prorocentrum_minimum.AAC.1
MSEGASGGSLPQLRARWVPHDRSRVAGEGSCRLAGDLQVLARCRRLPLRRRLAGGRLPPPPPGTPAWIERGSKVGPDGVQMGARGGPEGVQRGYSAVQ